MTYSQYDKDAAWAADFVRGAFDDLDDSDDVPDDANNGDAPVTK